MCHGITQEELIEMVDERIINLMSRLCTYRMFECWICCGACCPGPKPIGLLFCNPHYYDLNIWV